MYQYARRRKIMKVSDVHCRIFSEWCSCRKLDHEGTRKQQTTASRYPCTFYKTVRTLRTLLRQSVMTFSEYMSWRQAAPTFCIHRSVVTPWLQHRPPPWSKKKLGTHGIHPGNDSRVISLVVKSQNAQPKKKTQFETRIIYFEILLFLRSCLWSDGLGIVLVFEAL